MRWTTADIPPQAGRFAIITGTGGLGFESALALARAGADVVVAGRSVRKGAEACVRIRAAVPSARIEFEQLDLASLASISEFAGRLRQKRGHLDLLVNNAGVMMPPMRRETFDGFELQLGTNYLGHFALTAHLLPLLRKRTNSRVVTVSSVASRSGKLDFDDLQSKRDYASMTAYSQSKLACLVFAIELQRRSDAAGWGLRSVAAHPGIARTDLLHNAPGRWSFAGIARTLLWFLFQPASQGALPTLFAATSAEARGGDYYGPHGLSETRGFPTQAKIPPQALDAAAADRLWRVSERVLGITFPTAVRAEARASS